MRVWLRAAAASELDGDGCRIRSARDRRESRKRPAKAYKDHHALAVIRRTSCRRSPVKSEFLNPDNDLERDVCEQHKTARMLAKCSGRGSVLTQPGKRETGADPVRRFPLHLLMPILKEMPDKPLDSPRLVNRPRASCYDPASCRHYHQSLCEMFSQDDAWAYARMVQHLRATESYGLVSLYRRESSCAVYIRAGLSKMFATLRSSCDSQR